mgnify:CR=1 FL=1
MKGIFDRLLEVATYMRKLIVLALILFSVPAAATAQEKLTKQEKADYEAYTNWLKRDCLELAKNVLYETGRFSFKEKQNPYTARTNPEVTRHIDFAAKFATIYNAFCKK